MANAVLRRVVLGCCLCLTGLEAAADEVLCRIPVDAGAARLWRHKDNCRLQPGPASGADELHWTTAFGAFDFGWATYYPGLPLDLTAAARVSFQVKGDGSGHLLHLQLGLLEPGKETVYYVNRADRVRLDFDDWREVTFSLARFAPPAGRDPETDLRQVDFVQFFVTRSGDRPQAAMRLRDLRVIRATEEEKAMLARQRAALHFDLSSPPPRDGGNLLPNPDLELDADADTLPDVWRLNGRRERFAWDDRICHSPTRSLRIAFETDIQNASLGMSRSLGAGHWVLEAWYRTEGTARAPRHAVSVTLRMVDGDGVAVHSLSVFGPATEGAWRQLRQPFVTRADAARITLEFSHFAGEGTVWWDDLALRFDTPAAQAAEADQRDDELKAIQAVERLAALAPRIEALPETSAAETLKKAALRWGIEDARAAIEARLGGAALAVLGDVEALCDRPLGTRRDPPGELLPALASCTGNPYAESVLAAATAYARDTTTYKKGLAGYQHFRSGWEFRGLGDRVSAATWSFCQPHSPLAGDPGLLTFILRGLQAAFQNHLGGDLNPYRQLSHGYHDPNINRFAYCPTLEAYIWLRTTYPDLILPCKRAEWERSARAVLDFQIATYGDDKPRPEDIRYPNMDVTYMLMMALGGHVLGDPALQREGRRFLEGVAACLYPDGAFTYCDYQNECFVYHQMNVATVARYAQIAGDRLAHDVVRRSRPYYPLVVEPNGITEDYTDCFWKHYWSRLASPEGPEIVAGLTGCPLNKRIANQALQYNRPSGQFAVYAAMFYRDFPDAPLPDNFIVYDRNIEGPRGRYGRFSFAATGRDLGPGYQGKDTFVGCMVADAPGAANPLNAALQVVTNEVRIALGGQRWRSCRYLSQEERNASVLAADVASFSTHYRIQNVAWGGRSTLTEWAGSQQWIMTPHRLVGLLEIEAGADAETYAVHGRVRFGCGKGRNVQAKEIEAAGDRFFKYGMLLCRLHEHNYADVITEKAETFYIDKPEDFASREIVLRDAHSATTDGKSRRHCPKGTRHFFVVEIFPGWSEPAHSVTRLASDDGLRGLELAADGGHVLLLHNPTDVAAHFHAGREWATGRADVYRAGTEGSTPESLRLNGSLDLVVAPQRHVLLTKRSAKP